MIYDNIGDWRINSFNFLGQDLPPSYPGGPSHKKGATVYVSKIVKHKNFRLLGFITPNATALALDVALDTSNRAAHLLQEMEFGDGVTPYGDSKRVIPDSHPVLFDYFQQCMTSATFSLLALESFCNFEFAKVPTLSLDVTRRGEKIRMTFRDAERNLSITEKLAQALPELMNVPSPKGKKTWSGFVILRKIRDSTIHMKPEDVDTGIKIDDKSLFFRLLDNHPRTYPISALHILEWFFQQRDEPRWFQGFKEKLRV